jgi:predicted nucleic acid-binding protein
MTRIYWDSCVLIYRLQGTSPWRKKIAGMVAAQRAFGLVLSELSRLECRVKPLREGDVDTLHAFDRFFASARIEYAALTRTMFDRATELRAHQGLKTVDALHLAAALDAGCDAFWTNDRRLERAAAGRIQIVAVDELP